METQRRDTATTFDAARGVDLARLEKELTAMWADASREGEVDEKPGMVRACVLNLIVYAPAHDGRERLDALLNEVYESNPCRALVIFADPAADAESIDAYVSTRCSLSRKGAKQICGEQVTIEAAGRAVERAASAVEPLLVPDVPVFLWWKDIPHYEDKLFERLVRVADRVVIDSASFDHPHDDLTSLAKVVGEHPEHMAVSDLNWGRLTPWRSLAASFWDVEEYRERLRELERVEIVYAAQPDGRGRIPAAALLLAGWLASRLGWKVDGAATVAEERGASFALSAAGGRTVRLDLRAAEEACESGGELRSLTVSCGGGGAEFRVEMKPCGTKLETVSTIGAGERALGRVINFEEQTEGRRLGGELAILTRDKVFEHAAVAGASLVETMGR